MATPRKSFGKADVKRKSFTIEEKRTAVLEASRTSIQAVAQKYSVDRQNIRQWKRNLDTGIFSVEEGLKQ